MNVRVKAWWAGSVIVGALFGVVITPYLTHGEVEKSVNLSLFLDPVFTFLMVCATIVIAFYAFRSHDLGNKSYELAQEIKRANELKAKGDEEFRQEVVDLYKALVVSNVMGKAPSFGEADLNFFIGQFNKMYEAANGKLQIFKANV